VIRRKPYRRSIFNVPPTNADAVKISQIDIYIYIYILKFLKMFQILYVLIKNKIGTCGREEVFTHPSPFKPTLVVFNLCPTNLVSVEPEQHVWRNR
jgi:hypothetical protein